LRTQHSHMKLTPKWNKKTYNMGNVFWEHNTHTWNSHQSEISAWWIFAEEKQNLGLNERRRGLTDYQKAVKLKNLDVVAMEAIDPAARVNCVILRTSPRTEPGPPQQFIFYLRQIKSMITPSMPNNEHPFPDFSPKTEQIINESKGETFNINFTPPSHHTKSQTNRKIRHRNRDPKGRRSGRRRQIRDSKLKFESGLTQSNKIDRRKEQHRAQSEEMKEQRERPWTINVINSL